MDGLEQLCGFLGQYACLSGYDISLICSCFGHKNLKKEEYYFHKGACCCHLSFLVDGILGVFNPNGGNEETVSHFVTKNHFFTDPEGFDPGGCACFSIRALSPCTLWSIPLCDAQALFSEIPSFEKVVRQIREQSLKDIINSQKSRLTGSPASQYLRMFDELPEVVQLVALKYIASYLRIDQATLSRIRGKCH